VAAVTPELITSLGTLLVGIIGAATALILALRKRITEEELPELRRRVEELDAEARTDRAELAEARADVVLLDRHIFSLERTFAQHGLDPPPRPEPVTTAVSRSRTGRRHR